MITTGKSASTIAILNLLFKISSLEVKENEGNIIRSGNILPQNESRSLAIVDVRTDQ